MMLLVTMPVLYLMLLSTIIVSLCSATIDTVSSSGTPFSLCEFVASTNIESLDSLWSCDSSGQPISDPCVWGGVTCGGNQDSNNITRLYLATNSLEGSLPEVLGSLSTLTEFQLNHTRVAGSIPSSIGSLVALQKLMLPGNRFKFLPSEIGLLQALQELDLGENFLEGIIPSAVGQLSALQTLRLASNNMTGTFPASALQLCTGLEVLDLSENKLSGSISDSVGSLTQLQVLRLGGNSFYGSLPASVGCLSHLAQLDVSRCSLSGELPNTLGSLLVLERLLVSTNFFDSTVPSSVFAMTWLTMLHVNDNIISGTVPSSVGSMVNLTDLSLHSNQFSGTIPSEIGSLTNLVVLELHSCMFVGYLPEAIGDIGSSLVKLTGGGLRELSGGIPSSYGKLFNMRVFLFQDAVYTGTLPSSFGNFSAMEYIKLSGNYFTGTIPSSFGKMSRLLSMELEANLLTGQLPNIFHKDYLLYLALNANFFSGTVPTSLGRASMLVVMDLSNNMFTGPLPAQLGDVLLGSALLNSNSITGSIPHSLLASPLLLLLVMEDNSLSGVIPSNLGNVPLLAVLSLANNFLSGALPDTARDLAHLKYLSLQNNLLTGPIELLDLPRLEFADVSVNRFTGSVPGSLSAVLGNLNLASNKLTGSLPSAVASVAVLNKLSLGATSLTGSIPSEFCSSTGMSINVTGTAVHCYEGCLTSSQVIVYGASDQCHDGSIMARFLAAVGVVAGMVLIGTFLSKYSHALVELFSNASKATAGRGDGDGEGASSAAPAEEKVESFDGARLVSAAATPDDEAAAAWERLSQTYNPVVAIAVFKVCTVVVISLSLSNWWSLAGGSAVVASCSSPEGNCYSFCDTTVLVDIAFTDDDFKFDDVYVPPQLDVTEHPSAEQYCIAELHGECAFRYWLVFKLVPVVLHVLSFLLQLWMWRLCGDFTPQQKQYDTIVVYMFPNLQRRLSQRFQNVGVHLSNAHTVDGQVSRLEKWRCMFKELKEPQSFSVFAYIEMFTALYVWGELLFPATYCGAVRPLSLYYYPILMSATELIKFNMYLFVRLAAIGAYADALFALLDVEYFAVNLTLSCVLAVWFSTSICVSAWRFAVWASHQCYYGASGKHPNWPAGSRSSFDGVAVELNRRMESADNPLRKDVV